MHVPPGRPEALRDALRRMKSDPGLREEMGRRGRAFAETHFAISRCADAYEAVFAEMLGGRVRTGQCAG